MPITIHGKEYKTVAERLNEASKFIKSIKTEVLYIEPQVMVRATIETDKGTFTGISAANPSKTIEANTPVEVAETSAVGRALAFAGYAGSEIASADEMYKAGVKNDSKPAYKKENKVDSDKPMCKVHNVSMFQTPKMKSPAHRDDVKGWCNGFGFPGEEQGEVEDISDEIPF